MKKKMIYVILCYLVAICLCLIALLDGIGRNDIFLFCLASAISCFGSTLLYKINNKDKDE